MRTKAPGSKTMRLRVARLGFAAGVDVPDFALDADHLLPPLQDVVPAGSWLKWIHFRDAINGHPRLETKLLGYPGSPNGGNACWARTKRSISRSATPAGSSS